MELTANSVLGGENDPLRELLSAGLLTSQEEAESGGEKTIYTINKIGEQVLNAWLHGKLPKQRQTRDERMLRILFAESASPVHATMTLAVMQEEVEEKLAMIEAEVTGDRALPLYEERLRALEWERLAVTLAWIEETIETIGL